MGAVCTEAPVVTHETIFLLLTYLTKEINKNDIDQFYEYHQVHFRLTLHNVL